MKKGGATKNAYGGRENRGDGKPRLKKTPRSRHFGHKAPRRKSGTSQLVPPTNREKIGGEDRDESGIEQVRRWGDISEVIGGLGRQRQNTWGRAGKRKSEDFRQRQIN